MKKTVVLLLALLILPLLLPACGKDIPLKDCILSAERVVWGNRIYSIEEIPEKGTYLAYTEIGDETVHVGCLDPLCTHDKNECQAYSGALHLPVAVVPQKKGYLVYFFRSNSGLKDPGDPSEGMVFSTDLLVMDAGSGKSKVVTTIPGRMPTGSAFLLTPSDVWFSLNSAQITGDYSRQSLNLWRAPLVGGEIEQVTFAEDAASGYRLEAYEDGVFYYRHGETLCRTADGFATEEVVMENLNMLYKIVIQDGWVYYTDEYRVLSLTPGEPKPEEYAHVYGYAIGEFPDALDAANSCSLMRLKLDGSGTTEKLASGVATCPNELTPNWCVTGNTLYCVPASFELQGTVEWSTMESPNSLSYIWSETGGGLLAVDLDTGETKEVLSDLGFDIQSIEDTGGGKFLVSGRVYDLDRIRSRIEAEEIRSSELRYTVWELIDVKER